MQFRILGPIEVWNGAGWTPVPAAKQRALLAILLLRSGRVLERDWLIETLWNGQAPASAGRLLSHYAWRLRTLLPDAGRWLRTVPSGYLLEVEPDQVDHQQFSGLVAAGSAAARNGEPGRAVDQLTAALALWRGRALLGARSLPVIEAAAGQLEQLRVDARESLAESQLGCARPGDALAGLAELTMEEPYRERSWRLLMLALYRVGRRSDALAAYQRLWQVWTDQLGVEPSQELRELHRRMLADDASLRPDRAPPARPAQLPADLPAFTGRRSELDQLQIGRAHV